MHRAVLTCRLAVAADAQAEFEADNKPVVIRGVVDKWPAYDRWSPAHLVREYGDVTFSSGGYALSAREYMSYAGAIARQRTHVRQPIAARSLLLPV